MLYGTSDSEPQDIVLAQLAHEFYNSNMLLLLIHNLHRIDFEVSSGWLFCSILKWYWWSDWFYMVGLFKSWCCQYVSPGTCFVKMALGLPAIFSKMFGHSKVHRLNIIFTSIFRQSVFIYWLRILFWVKIILLKLFLKPYL